MAETRATAPAKENPRSQSGREVSRKGPSVQISAGQVAPTKALSRVGSNGCRAEIGRNAASRTSFEML
jgi:hypothetical protein